FRLDPHATRCALASDPVADARMTAAHLRDEGAIPVATRPNGPTTRREMLQWLPPPAALRATRLAPGSRRPREWAPPEPGRSQDATGPARRGGQYEARR